MYFQAYFMHLYFLNDPEGIDNGNPCSWQVLLRTQVWVTQILTAALGSAPRLLFHHIHSFNSHSTGTCSLPGPSRSVLGRQWTVGTKAR